MHAVLHYLGRVVSTCATEPPAFSAEHVLQLVVTHIVLLFIPSECEFLIIVVDRMLVQR